MRYLFQERSLSELSTRTLHAYGTPHDYIYSLSMTYAEAAASQVRVPHLQNAFQPLGMERSTLTVDEVVDAEAFRRCCRPISHLVVPVAVRVVLERKVKWCKAGGGLHSLDTNTRNDHRGCTLENGALPCVCSRLKASNTRKASIR